MILNKKVFLFWEDLFIYGYIIIIAFPYLCANNNTDDNVVNRYNYIFLHL